MKRVLVLTLDDDLVKHLTELYPEDTVEASAHLPPQDWADFNLVFWDGNLPGALRAIKSHGSLEEIPVVALVAESAWGMRSQYLSAGFADYLQRFPRKDQITNLMDQHRQESDIFDYVHLEELSGGDVEFEVEIVQTFLDNSPALITAAQEALGQQNFEPASAALHTLKGSARSVGANRFAEYCAQLEFKIKTNNFPEKDELLEKFEEFRSTSNAHYDLSA